MSNLIGERERANLVVQLARFFYIYVYCIYPALMYAVMFYVILNKRKRLGDCVTFLYLSGRCTCQGAASYHAFSQRVHAGCQFSPTSSWCGLGSCFMRLSSVGSLPLAKNALHSPTSTLTAPVSSDTYL